MNFIFKLTLREIRSSWRRLLFFFVCIGIGVGSIVALRSMIGNANTAVSSEARFLLTADVEISSTAPLSEAENAAVETIKKQNSDIIETVGETIHTSTTAKPADEKKIGTQMLELKGVDATFPLAGEFKTADGAAFNYSLLQNKGAVVAPLVLEKLKLNIGDKLKIGAEVFEIRAVFTEEPGGATGFRLGPRVFIERTSFEESGLTVPGNRYRRRILFRTVPEQAEKLAADFRAALKETNSLVGVRSFKEAEANISESFSRAENFLSLTGLVILVLGGVGVWNVTRVFVEQKKYSIAVLKCVGATGTRVTLAYLLQILTLGFLGSAFGALLAKLALILVERNLAESLPSNMQYGLQTSAVLQGFALGLAVSGLFAALPLLEIGRIKPRLLLRDGANEAMKRFTLTNIFVGVLVIAGLMLLAVWQANSWRIGIYFLLGLAATAGALYFSAFLLTKFLRLFRNVSGFTLRQSINSLSRPGNQTSVILLAVGLGVFVVLTVQSLQTNLQREFDFLRNGTLPTLFLIDIPRKEAEAVKEFFQQEIGETIEIIPAIRGRISAVNGKPIDLEQREVRQQSGQIGREYVMTYRPNLVGDEKITAGEFWDNTPSAEPEVSLEEGMKDLQNLDVGGTITFDVSGQKITARVTSFRKLDVRNTRSTFQVLFRPGAMENAPQTALAAVYSRLESEKRDAIRQKLNERFPALSAIDTSDAVAGIRRLIDNMTLAVTFVGGFVFFCGALILVGSIALTKFQRIYESAILKTLGARRKTLLVILLCEYGLLGLLAGAIGAGAALVLSYFVTKYVFEVAWQANFALLGLGVISTILLVTIVGAVSSFDVLLKKPLAILRSQ